MITVAPYSMANQSLGVPTSIDIALEPISWTVPTGHHLTLVIDTADTRYAAPGFAAGTITFSSPATDPARLTIPVG